MLGDIRDSLLMIKSEPQHGPSEASLASSLHCDTLHKVESLKKESICVLQAWKKRLDSLSTPPLGSLHIPDRPIYSSVPFTE